MIKCKLATGYLKWDGKKYILENHLDQNFVTIPINIENNNLLYFSNGSAKLINK